MSVTFPNAVWDGTSRTRGDFSVVREGDGFDWDRCVEEIRAVQRHLLGGPLIKAARTITEDDSVVFSDYAIYGDATLSEVKLTLGDASNFEGKIIVVKKMDVSANKVVLTGTVDDIVNPELTSQFDSLVIQAHSGSWRVN
jgi:hypothetical protein